jgi:hypothetical protein
MEAFFKASIRCAVGDGADTLFWSDPWLDGCCIPDLVASALAGHSWIQDIQCPLTVLVLAQYLQLRQLLDTVVLRTGLPDRVIWRWSASRQYSTSSAYRAMDNPPC